MPVRLYTAHARGLDTGRVQVVTQDLLDTSVAQELVTFGACESTQEGSPMARSNSIVTLAAALLAALPAADRESVLLQVGAKPAPKGKRAAAKRPQVQQPVVEYTAPRTRTAFKAAAASKQAKAAKPLHPTVALARQYTAGADCPFCAQRGLVSPFDAVQEHTIGNGSKRQRAHFAACHHTVNVYGE